MSRFFRLVSLGAWYRAALLSYRGMLFTFRGARYPAAFFRYRGRGFCPHPDTRYPSAFLSYKGRVGRMEKGLKRRPFFTLPSPPVQLACFLQNGSVICLFLSHKVDRQRFVVLVYLSFSPMGYCNTNLIQTCVRTLTLNSGHSFFLCAGGKSVLVSLAYLL